MNFGYVHVCTYTYIEFYPQIYSNTNNVFLPWYFNNIKLRLIIYGCLYIQWSVTVHNHLIANFEFLSYCVSCRCIVKRKWMYCSFVLSSEHILTSTRSITHTPLCPPTFCEKLVTAVSMVMLSLLCVILWIYRDHKSVCTTCQHAQTCAVCQPQFQLLTAY